MGGDSFQKKSELRRFFVEDLSSNPSTVRISGDEFTHLKRVLRLTVGAQVSVFDGKGLDLCGVIEETSGSYALISIKGRSEIVPESRLHTVLIQGILKGDKTEFVVQKATELGVNEICFFGAERSVPLIREKTSKEGRWKKAAIEAAKQCGRSVVPRLSFADDISKVLFDRDEAIKLMLWEGGGAVSLKNALSCASSAAMLVGPEGGFSQDEAKLAVAAGFIPVSLGPRILRAETAALSGLAALQFALGDMG